MQVFRIGLCIGVTTKDPDSGPVPRWGDIANSDQYWYVYIGTDGCKAWHKGKERKLQLVLDCSAGNTFGCHVSGTGELHLHHNGRDVGVACEGLPTDQPLWGFLELSGHKVEANYVFAQSEAVCVSVCMSSWPLRWKVFLYQGRRKHFRIGQAIKFFRSLRSQILVFSYTLTRPLHFMISKCKQPGS